MRRARETERGYICGDDMLDVNARRRRPLRDCPLSLSHLPDFPRTFAPQNPIERRDHPSRASRHALPRSVPPLAERPALPSLQTSDRRPQYSERCSLASSPCGSRDHSHASHPPPPSLHRHLPHPSRSHRRHQTTLQHGPQTKPRDRLDVQVLALSRPLWSCNQTRSAQWR